jgi:hypothetical protein
MTWLGSDGSIVALLGSRASWRGVPLKKPDADFET